MNNIQSLSSFLLKSLRRNPNEDYNIDGILIGPNDIKITARKKVGFRILPHYKEYTINLKNGEITRTSSNPYKSRKIPIRSEDFIQFNSLVNKELNFRRNHKSLTGETDPNEQLFQIFEKIIQAFFYICEEGEKSCDKPVKDITYYNEGIKCSTIMGIDHQSLYKEFDQALKLSEKSSALIHIPCNKNGHLNNDHFFKRKVNGNVIIGLLDGVGSAEQFSNAKKVSRQFKEKLTDNDYEILISKINKIVTQDEANEIHHEQANEVCNQLKEIIDNYSDKDNGEFTFAIIFNLRSGIHTFFKGDTHAGIYDIKNKKLEVFTKKELSSNNLYSERSFTTLADAIVPNTDDWNLTYNFNVVNNSSTLFLATDGISDLFPLMTGKQEFEKCPSETTNQVKKLFKKLNKPIPKMLSYIVHDFKSIESIFNICEGEPARIKRVLEIFCKELEMTKKDDRTGYFLKISKENDVIKDEQKITIKHAHKGWFPKISKENKVIKNELDITRHGDKIHKKKQVTLKPNTSNHSCSSNASTAQLTETSSSEAFEVNF